MEDALRVMYSLLVAMGLRDVLILILMEDALRDYTQLLTGASWVLILILMEDALREYFLEEIEPIPVKVLILILMEDALREKSNGHTG